MTAAKPGVRARVRRTMRRTMTKVLPSAAVDAITERRQLGGGGMDRSDHGTFRLAVRDKLLVIEPKSSERAPLGIYLFGGCDLPSLFAMGPRLGPVATRAIVVATPGNRMVLSRPDLLLQTLQPLPDELTREVALRLGLPNTYFRPEVFRPSFDPHVRSLGRVDKGVIVLSGGASLIRPAYRHREAGFLVDPGGRWLRNTADRLSREDRAWFTSTFESVGKVSVEQFRADMAALVRELRARTGAEVLVLNTLTVEPGSREHNYQLRRSPEGVRRLEFHLALAELAEEVGFHVVDVDDALKRAGIHEQVDFAHFPTSAYDAVARHAATLLEQMGIV